MAHIADLLKMPPTAETTAPSTLALLPSTAATSSKIIGSDWAAFQTFGNAGLVGMAKAAQDFAISLTTPLTTPRWLSMLGTSGAGKTMLAKMIVADARAFCETHPYLEGAQRIRHVKFVNWPKAAEQLRGGDYGALEGAASAWLTVIDDIGAEHDARSSFIPSKLYDLLNDRLGRWTVITSNRGLADLATMDARIASRMRREYSDIVEVKVPDFFSRKLTT